MFPSKFALCPSRLSLLSLLSAGPDGMADSGAAALSQRTCKPARERDKDRNDLAPCSRKISARSALIAALLISPHIFAASRPVISADARTSVPGVARTASSKSEKQLSLRRAAAGASFSFVPNRGQAKKNDLFVARSGETSIALQQDGLEVDTVRIKAKPQTITAGPEAGDGSTGMSSARMTYAASDVSRVKLQFAGANPAANIEGLDATVSRVNYIHGNDPKQWQTNLPSYRRVKYTGLYPGVDLVYYGECDRHLEYDLVVAPGADPDQIQLSVSGDRAASIDASGNLLLDGAEGGVRLVRPVLYQNIEGGKRAVQGSFVKRSDGRFGFSHAAYDRTRPLIIDPTISLLYATYAGGIHNDEAFDLTLDAKGNAYLAGQSASEDFPVTSNAFQPTRSNLGSYVYDAVVMKFDSSGTLLVSTFLGGSQNEQGEGIRVDASGLIYLTGSTNSSDFPVTANALQPTYGGNGDAYFSVLSSDGSQLLYSTYLGGAGSENAYRMIADPSGAFWLAGSANASGLPATAGAYQPQPNGADNGFVAKVTFNAALPQPLTINALTFLGGSSQDNEFGLADIALDATGNVYVTGSSNSTDFPVTANAYQKSSSFTISSGCSNSPSPHSIVTVSEFSADLKKLIYSTALGGKTEDQNGYPVCNQLGRTIHPDGKGNIWVIGTVGMSDFPTTANALSRQLNGNGNAGVDSFIAELTPGAQSTTLTYGSYLGGSGFDYGSHGVWDATGNIWIVTATQSYDWPGIVTGTSLQPTIAGGYDIGLLELQPDGSKILYSTYLGGNGDEDANSGRASIALDANSNVYLAGGTGSGNFPVTPNAVQPTFADGDAGPDGYDLYYAVLGAGSVGVVTPASGGNAGDVTVTVSGSGIQTNSTCSLTLNGTTITSILATVNATGTSIACTFPLSGANTGNYTVAVISPGGVTTSAASTFTVQNGGGPDLWVDIVGRSTLRVGEPSNFAITYGNSGTTDAYGVTLYVRYDPTLTSSIFNSPSASNSYGDLPLSPVPDFSGDGTSYNAISPMYTSSVDGYSVVPILISKIPAGTSSSFLLPLEADALGDDATIEVYTWQAYATSQADLNNQFNVLPPLDKPSQLHAQAESSVHPNADAGSGGASGACIQEIIFQAVKKAAGAVPGSSCVDNATTAFADTLIATKPGYASYALPAAAADLAKTLVSCGLAGASAAAEAAKIAADVLDNLEAAQAAIDACKKPASPPKPPKKKTTKKKNSKDPNDKGGSSGDGSASQYVVPDTPLSYSLAFENQATATLPVAKLVITDQLDGTKVDLSTLTLGPINFGANIINTPGGLTNYTTTFTPPGVTAYAVRIQGSLNAGTGLLTWTFEAIDPATGLPPTDPTVGFLPPDSDGIVGQGSVVFEVMPLAGLTTGTQITNTASIVFDANAAISTPTWLNTIDADAPVSAVTALPMTVAETGATTPFTVNWSGTDNGSGILYYDIYVSDNGGAYSLWQAQASAASAVYTGETGHTYSFYSLATDSAGNIEAAKTSPDTTTQIVLPPTTTMLAASATSILQGTSVTFTATVAQASGTVLPTGTVTFYDGSTSLGTGTLSSGSTTFATASLTPGSHSITASYGGDTNYSGSVSSAVSVTVTPLLAATATKLTASAATAVSGSALTFTAVVSETSGSATPTGMVTFYDGSASLGSGALASGAATFSTSALSVGTHTITAAYAGDSSSAASTSAGLPITITAMPPDFSIALNPASGTVSQGSSVTSTITIAPAGGFNQQVTLTCSGLPANASCSFSPASVTPNGTSVATSTVTISTNVTAAALRQPRTPGRTSGGPITLASLEAAGLLALALFRSRRKSRNWSRLQLALILALAAASSAIGCGSSGATTPKGTSQIAITATAGPTTHSAAYSLTVQ